MRVILLLLLFSVTYSWVIYRKNHKKRLICREETEWANATANYMTNSAIRSGSDEEDDSSSSDEERSRKRTRTRRDIDVDPVHKEPIIYLGFQTSSNSTVFIDDGDFDIVSDQLTKEELEMVKQQIMETCNALNSS